MVSCKLKLYSAAEAVAEAHVSSLYDIGNHDDEVDFVLPYHPPEVHDSAADL